MGNYKSFRAIVRQVANECITSTPGPVEIMGLCRRHWNDIKEPQVSDLRSRVIKKKKKIREKNRAAKNKLAKNLLLPLQLPLTLSWDLRIKLPICLQQLIRPQLRR